MPHGRSFPSLPQLGAVPASLQSGSGHPEVPAQVGSAEEVPSTAGSRPAAPAPLQELRCQAGVPAGKSRITTEALALALHQRALHSAPPRDLGSMCTPVD